MSKRGMRVHQTFYLIVVVVAWPIQDETSVIAAAGNSRETNKTPRGNTKDTGEANVPPQDTEIARLFSKEFDEEFFHISDDNVYEPYISNRNRTKRSLIKNRSDRFKKRMREQFDKYETCMEDNEDLSKKMYSGFVKARIAMEGQSVKLSCMICIRPDQAVEKYNVKWRRRVLSSEKEKPVKIDHKRFILLPDKTLMINQINLEDGGIYHCYRGQGHAATYMVDILRGERYQVVFKPPDKGKRPARTKRLWKYNIKIRTHWSEWSKCNQCNKRGQHRRMGFCTVKKLYENKPLKPENVPWLDQFKEGLPCRSSLLPPTVRGLQDVRRRSSEILMGYCITDCPTLPPIKTYTDADGNVLEVVKSNKGFVSMKEGVPKLPKMVKRKMIYEKRGRRIKLDCPHGRKGEVSVRWQNGSQTMNALTVRRESRGRIVIDPLHNLRIRRLKMYDTAAYSCWVDGEHIATIKIRVITKMRRSYKDYILLAGFVAVILILCCVGCCVCCGQDKKTLK